MFEELYAGQPMNDIRRQWGEPDLIEYPNQNTQVWSYAARSNSNDPVAFTVYTSAKGGDTGTFLDVKMYNGRLVSWAEVQHTLPQHQSGTFGVGIGSGGAPTTSHY